MRQTIVTLAAEVQPRSLDALRASIAELKAAVESQAGTALAAYDSLREAIPSLHFASIMVFEDSHYDSLLTVELNIDGDVGPFLPQLETAGLEPYLRAMVRCCKRPSGSAGELYDLVTAPKSKVPLAAFLETRIVRPAVFHQGNRGLDRQRILREAALFCSVQEELKKPHLYRAPDAVTLHQDLRAAMTAKFPWLDGQKAERVSGWDNIVDWGRLIGFVALCLFCLSIPGIVLGLILPHHVVSVLTFCALFLLVVAVLAVWRYAEHNRAPSRVIPGLATPPQPRPDAKLKIAGAIVGLLAFPYVEALVAALLLTLVHSVSIGHLFHVALPVFWLGFSTVPIMLVAIVGGIRWLETRDSTQDAPPVDLPKLQRILALEDQIAQNHMGSVVLVKPGILRAVLLRAGLWGLGLLLRVTARDGYLASMRTIHFAHWAILNNGGRLVFFSNFDSSWESYLDDFIEKAHVGLTLAWTNGVGFPVTKFLINEGATSGRLFKAWARQSMAEGLFWFSAYRSLSVNQIERQYRIASGLSRPRLSAAEATVWACDL